METKYRLMSLGIDPNLRHYGLVNWYDAHIWTGGNQPGKGRVRAYIPYAKGKKWRAIDIFAEDIENNREADQVLHAGDFVGFAMNLGYSGLKATNLLVVREKQTEAEVEKIVNKAINVLREDGYISPLASKDLDFFGGHLALEYPPTTVEEKPLPKIQKAPRNG